MRTWVQWVGLLWLLFPSMLVAQINEAPRQLEDVGITEHLGETIPLGLEFVNQAGEQVRLEQYFTSERPVILNLVYYNCPMLCNMVLNGFVKALGAIDLEIGRDFDIVTVSIDPTEGPELAAAKRENYLKSLGQPDAGQGWHFLTGAEGNIKRLADTVGFDYRYDENQKQYAHAAAIFVLTADGRLSRYLYGIEFVPKDLRLALLEASDGKIGNTIDQLILFCYHFDSQANSYVLAAMNVMRLGGGLTVVLMALLLLPVWYRSWRGPVTGKMAVEGTHE